MLKSAAIVPSRIIKASAIRRATKCPLATADTFISNEHSNHNQYRSNQQRNFSQSAFSSSIDVVTPFTKREEESSNNRHQLSQSRQYTLTTKTERGMPTLALGLGAVALTAKAGQLTVTAFKEWKASQPEEPEKKEETQDQASSEQTETKKKETKGKRENIFSSFFDVGTNYYEGGFEEKMTKREAALILGVRASSTEKRIKEAHRKLLILNHPDRGGSKYLSGKVNEAKELLLKGKAK
ncbi:hypothetical protein CTEN210_07797 [Chaetoceros tenuissimus]|uniref:J domain-containing protein n=1 Tax=Chaetoceros tenuissimus TaxID=426638 RepID=A0AAD3CUD1_9STRA|nr:hypothetical protein CTEN210_07797 [Chaetoceros tenuissimus]